MLTDPWGILMILSTLAVVPTEYRSAKPGVSVSGLRWVSRPISDSFGFVSASSALLRSRPTVSGVTVPG